MGQLLSNAKGPQISQFQPSPPSPFWVAHFFDPCTILPLIFAFKLSNTLLCLMGKQTSPIESTHWLWLQLQHKALRVPFHPRFRPNLVFRWRDLAKVQARGRHAKTTNSVRQQDWAIGLSSTAEAPLSKRRTSVNTRKPCGWSVWSHQCQHATSVKSNIPCPYPTGWIGVLLGLVLFWSTPSDVHHVICT